MAIKQSDPTFHTVDAAEYLGLPVRLLESWRCRRPYRGPAYQKYGRTVRYTKASLDEFRERSTVAPEIAND
jgi:hypothetical protein